MRNVGKQAIVLGRYFVQFLIKLYTRNEQPRVKIANVTRVVLLRVYSKKCRRISVSVFCSCTICKTYVTESVIIGKYRCVPFEIKVLVNNHGRMVSTTLPLLTGVSRLLFDL